VPVIYSIQVVSLVRSNLAFITGSIFPYLSQWLSLAPPTITMSNSTWNTQPIWTAFSHWVDGVPQRILSRPKEHILVRALQALSRCIDRLATTLNETLVRYSMSTWIAQTYGQCQRLPWSRFIRPIGRALPSVNAQGPGCTTVEISLVAVVWTMWKLGGWWEAGRSMAMEELLDQLPAERRIREENGEGGIHCRSTQKTNET